MFVLVGSGEYLPQMEPVDRALLERLDEAARVVCLPTAAGTESPDRIVYWSELSATHFGRLGLEARTVPVIDRASANEPRLADQIRAANFVYLSGGRPDYLYKTLKDSLAWAAITHVVAQGGILAGCSAGAMVQGEKFFGFPGWRTGFGLIPGVAVLPHYDEIPEAFISPARLLTPKRLTVVGVDGLTALVRNPDGGYEVLGQGSVTVWGAMGKTRHTAGPLDANLLS